MILDGVKDHVVPHIAEKNTSREMWEALTTLVLGIFHPMEDAIRKSAEIIPDAERRGDRSLPSEVAKDSRPVDFRGVYTRS